MSWSYSVLSSPETALKRQVTCKSLVISTWVISWAGLYRTVRPLSDIFTRSFKFLEVGSYNFVKLTNTIWEQHPLVLGEGAFTSGLGKAKLREEFNFLSVKACMVDARLV